MSRKTTEAKSTWSVEEFSETYYEFRDKITIQMAAEVVAAVGKSGANSFEIGRTGNPDEKKIRKGYARMYRLPCPLTVEEASEVEEILLHWFGDNEVLVKRPVHKSDCHCRKSGMQFVYVVWN